MTRQRMTFTVAGSPTTNNRATRIYRGIAVHNPEAKSYEDRLRGVVTKAIQDCGWMKVGNEQAVAVSMVCWNLSGDIDGRTKIAFDAMQDLVFDDDSCIKRKYQEERLDRNGPRIDFRIREIPKPVMPPKERHIAFADLSDEDYRVLLYGDKNAVLDPVPGRVRPAIVGDIPAAWTVRARRILGIEKT